MKGAFVDNIVLVEWVDIESLTDWTDLKTLFDEKPPIIHSVGELYGESDDHITLVATRDGTQYLQALVIPRGCIRSITYLYPHSEDDYDARIPF